LTAAAQERDVDLNELQALMDEYIASLDDVKSVEWFTTDKGLANGELRLFMAWLQKRAAQTVGEA
jgi:hypothetical protein